MKREACVPNLCIETSLLMDGHAAIAGVDEVGRGSLAGPVVAAAVVLPLSDSDLLSRLEGVRDSKQLSHVEREVLAQRVMDVATHVALGWASHHTIDRLGLGPANRLAMERAVARLPRQPSALIVDHVRLTGCALHQVCIPRADARSLSVASASIVAKAVRDRWMTRWDAAFPEYGFGRHKGYGTPQHLSALDTHGPCPLHRQSFAPVGARAR